MIKQRILRDFERFRVSRLSFSDTPHAEGKMMKMKTSPDKTWEWKIMAEAGKNMKRTLAFLGFVQDQPLPMNLVEYVCPSRPPVTPVQAVMHSPPRKSLVCRVRKPHCKPGGFFCEIICEIIEIGLRSYSQAVQQKSSDRNQEPAELRWYCIQVFRGLFWKQSHVPMGHLLFMDCLLAFKSASRNTPHLVPNSKPLAGRSRDPIHRHSPPVAWSLVFILDLHPRFSLNETVTPPGWHRWHMLRWSKDDKFRSQRFPVHICGVAFNVALWRVRVRLNQMAKVFMMHFQHYNCDIQFVTCLELRCLRRPTYPN